MTVQDARSVVPENLTVKNTTLEWRSLRAPLPYYRNEWFQYLCNGVLRTSGISLTGKEAIKMFYFSEGFGKNPATQHN